MPWNASENVGSLRRVTPQSGHAEELFEGIVAHRTGQAGEEFTFLYTAPLRSGAYRIDVVVKDVGDDRKGTWTGTIDVLKPGS